MPQHLTLAELSQASGIKARALMKAFEKAGRTVTLNQALDFSTIAEVLIFLADADRPDPWQLLLDIDTWACMLPTFQVIHDGGEAASAANIIEAIKKAATLLRSSLVARSQEWARSDAELAAIYGELAAINETSDKDKTSAQKERVRQLRAEAVELGTRRYTLASSRKEIE